VSSVDTFGNVKTSLIGIVVDVVVITGSITTTTIKYNTSDVCRMNILSTANVVAAFRHKCIVMKSSLNKTKTKKLNQTHLL